MRRVHGARAQYQQKQKKSKLPKEIERETLRHGRREPIRQTRRAMFKWPRGKI